MGKLAVFFAEGYEEIEALTVVDVCRRCGLEVDMVAVPGAATQDNTTALHAASQDKAAAASAQDGRWVKSSHNVTVRMDKTFEQVNFDEYDMLVLPGGKLGTENLEAHEGLMAQVDAFYEGGKYVAAICAAPSILGHRGILKGRKACCYPGFESQLESAEVTEGPVEVSDKVVTARGMGASVDFALAIAGIFCGQDKADEMAKTICYRR